MFAGRCKFSPPPRLLRGGFSVRRALAAAYEFRASVRARSASSWTCRVVRGGATEAEIEVKYENPGARARRDRIEHGNVVFNEARKTEKYR